MNALSRDLETVVRTALARAFPDLPPDAPLTSRALQGDGWHAFAVVQAGGDPRHQVLMKGFPDTGLAPSEWDRHAQLLAAEHWVLSEVAPRIVAENPATRCPQVLGYDPARRILLLEVVNGVSLGSVLFSLRAGLGRDVTRRLLALCGEWLARFHRLTRARDAGNPLEWLLAEFEQPAARAVFERAGDVETHRSLVDLVRRLRDDRSDLRAPRSLVHGVFAPYHVLVEEGRIYVIDLESCHEGYAYEDLALFLARSGFLPPWRRAVAAWRAGSWRHVFLEAYTAYAGPDGAPDDAVLGLARLHALLRLPLHWARTGGEAPALRARLRDGWWRRRFRDAWREERPRLLTVVGAGHGVRR